MLSEFNEDATGGRVELKYRAIGVARFKEKKPHVNWAGLFGLGGEDKQYGFEPHVCPSLFQPLGLSQGER